MQSKFIFNRAINIIACAMTSSETMVDNPILCSEFVQEKALKPLRICCYGSSSSRTPERYLEAARSLGYIIAARGHTCVNGAGSFGCMAAMNDGAAMGNGHIVGVIHEMFLVDSMSDVRDGGAHPVFDECLKNQSAGKTDGPTIEILVAGGNDLQERKRLLVDKADALVVLPGGPGTWDELWEMACARQIGLSQLPIVCVNVDGFYEPFRTMLERAGKDKLLHLEPSKIVHFEDTAEDAVKWIENMECSELTDVKVKKRPSALRRSSFLHNPILGKSDSWLNGVISKSASIVTEVIQVRTESPWFRGSAIFAAGISIGFLISRGRSRHMQ